MKIEKVDTPGTGTWSRDCELLYLTQDKGLKIGCHRDEDDTYWGIQCKRIVAYKVINEELFDNTLFDTLAYRWCFF